MTYQHKMLDDDFDLEEDATRVQPSPFSYGGTQIAYGSVLHSLPDESGAHAVPAAPAAPVQHSYSEPARGYPPYAAYIPAVEVEEPQACAEEPMPSYEIAISAEPWTPPATSQVRDVSSLPAEQVWPGQSRQGQETAPLVRPAPREDETRRWERAAKAADSGSYVAASSATPYVASLPPPLPASPLSPYYVAVTPSGSAARAASQYPTTSAPAVAPSAAPSLATPPQQPATATPVPASQETSVRTGRAIWGGLLGAIAGAGIWGGVGFVTGGLEIKYAAVVLGVLVGLLGARMARGTSKGVGVICAVLSVIGLAAGKALFELLVQPGLTIAGHIAYHTTPIDFIFFGATLVTGYLVGSGRASPRALLRRRPTVHVGVPGVPGV